MHDPLPPARGRAMQFIRRHDLTPHTRIDIVKLAWLNQGIYGKMTHITQEYHLSRTFLYQLIGAANLQLETLFSDQKPCVQAPQALRPLAGRDGPRWHAPAWLHALGNVRRGAVDTRQEPMFCMPLL